jgi:hypothetical protein
VVFATGNWQIKPLNHPYLKMPALKNAPTKIWKCEQFRGQPMGELQSEENSF